MKKIIASILLFAVFCLVNMGGNSIADEVVLCVSQENQYAVLTDEAGNCLEEESEITVSGSSIKKSDSYVPLANFQANDDCDGEGSKMNIGFDTNQSGALEPEEILSSSSTCQSLSEASSEEVAEIEKLLEPVEE